MATGTVRIYEIDLPDELKPYFGSDKLQVFDVEAQGLVAGGDYELVIADTESGMAITYPHVPAGADGSFSYSNQAHDLVKGDVGAANVTATFKRVELRVSTPA